MNGQTGPKQVGQMHVAEGTLGHKNIKEECKYAVFDNTVVVFKEENGRRVVITAYHSTRFQLLLMLPNRVLDEVRQLLPEVRKTLRSIRGTGDRQRCM